MEELVERVKRKGEGVVRHFHLRHHNRASVTSAFRSSVGYVARRSEQRFDKRMDRYMYERTTAVKEKVNMGKSEKHERRSSGKKETNSGEERKESANEEDGARVRTRVQPPCRRRRRGTK